MIGETNILVFVSACLFSSSEEHAIKKLLAALKMHNWHSSIFWHGFVLIAFNHFMLNCTTNMHFHKSKLCVGNSESLQLLHNQGWLKVSSQCFSHVPGFRWVTERISNAKKCNGKDYKVIKCFQTPVQRNSTICLN